MSHALVFEVAALISSGAMLTTRSYAVGARVPGGGVFICLDRAGQIIDAPEVHDETTSDGREHDRRGNGARWVKVTMHDWSAFGAARAFVGACKAVDVERAIKKASGR